MRTHIDPEIARLAAVRVDVADHEELRQSVDLSKNISPDIDFLDQVENNARFHRLLARVSHNLFYAIIEDVIMDFTVEFIRTVQLEHEILHEPNDHEDILQAVLDRDPDRAAAITRAHIEKIGSQMMELEEVFLKLSSQKTAASVR
jgi:DNA-binding FadR family transcriptional regulator